MKVLAFSRQGRELGAKIASEFGGECCVFYKYAKDGDRAFKKASDIAGEAFSTGEPIVFISSVGIAVRTIAPFICSKEKDSAVAAIDETGKFAVSVLSGHLGGANALVENIAEFCGAEAVITTATDRNGLFSVDDFARKEGLVLEDMPLAKEISARLLRGEPVGFLSDFVRWDTPLGLCAEAEYGVYVGYRNINPFKRTLRLVPKLISAGIGCRRGMTSDKISAAVEYAADMCGINPLAIGGVASVDLKANEKGLLQYCSSINISPVFYSPAELSEVLGEFSGSDFVKRTAGVDNVCERAAVKAGGGRLICKKIVKDGVTVAFAEEVNAGV